MIREDNTENDLRLDGYYYHYEFDEEGNRYIKNEFFYQNGVLLDNGSYRTPITLNEVDTHIRNIYKGLTDKQRANVQPKYLWGLYKIDQNKIRIERYETPLAPSPYKVIQEQGKILNDTTFVITRRKLMHKKKEESVQDTFRFRQYSPKPDSTNKFVN